MGRTREGNSNHIFMKNQCVIVPLGSLPVQTNASCTSEWIQSYSIIREYTPELIQEQSQFCLNFTVCFQASRSPDTGDTKLFQIFKNPSGSKSVGLIPCNEHSETISQRNISVVLGRMQKKKKICVNCTVAVKCIFCNHLEKQGQLPRRLFSHFQLYQVGVNCSQFDLMVAQLHP